MNDIQIESIYDATPEEKRMLGYISNYLNKIKYIDDRNSNLLKIEYLDIQTFRWGADVFRENVYTCVVNIRKTYIKTRKSGKKNEKTSSDMILITIPVELGDMIIRSFQIKELKNKIQNSNPDKDKYIHIKSGKTYDVLDFEVINGTNENDGQVMVLYRGPKKDGRGNGLFVREISEFHEKFRLK